MQRKLKTASHSRRGDLSSFRGLVHRGGFLVLFLAAFILSHSQSVRLDIPLNDNWYTRATDTLDLSDDAFEQNRFEEPGRWKKVRVPHNWDSYEGYRRKLHGNRHGYAYYSKQFSVKLQPKGKRIFLFFEGVGSYATVWLNEKKIGYHAGGRTTFTIDVTDHIRFDNTNLLHVRADHPAGIKDLPWVCGGCSDERGFSEGSQPMGIFRPVHLIVTNNVLIEPFGVHVWNDTTVSEKAAQLYYQTEIKNYSKQKKNITLISRLIDKAGKTVNETKAAAVINPGQTSLIKQQPPFIKNPRLWNLADPYLYKLVTEVIENGKTVDRTTTDYGIRWISWPVGKAPSSNQFLLNGKPVFINGIAEYEHLLGGSHAFSAEQIHSRVMQMKAAGFNFFRDAHHPHNLRYQSKWDSLGILWWTQMGAHIWYDNPEFRNNFKTLLKEWVKERRNNPSNVMWGLQNESKLPEDFARECTEIIRQLDPTASSQRLVTTCNGGSGTDWDVPQNWTGTYGGNPATYSQDLKRQIFVGEYGAWRTLDLHTEGPFVQNGAYSEDRMTQLMEMKLRLAEEAKDSAAGHIMWLFTSHDNPGRVQGGEGYRELDRIGPVNYKGLLTPWEEPLDVYYMYRSNYAPKEKEPMVYIASHTWPGRWTTTGKKNGIVVYSNCDEVELFNDVRSLSLGRKKRGGIGTHFTWDGVDIQYNVLYAVGYVAGKEVARDYIVLHHLPQSPRFTEFYKDAKPITAPQAGYNYLYRVNCGGPEYKDSEGNSWMADRALPQTPNPKPQTSAWSSTSWTADFPGMPPYFASQRTTSDPIRGTKDWKLFQSFRYGLDKLQYHFPVQDGEYLIELYFTEPWLGTGGGMDATGWRLFDVAVNDKIVLKDVDIWKEVGHDGALKKTVKATVKGGVLTVSFPRVAAGQAVISAIAIATLNKNAKPALASPTLIENFSTTSLPDWKVKQSLNIGDEQFGFGKIRFHYLPSFLFGTEWLQTQPIMPTIFGNIKASFTVTEAADVYVAYQLVKPEWLQDFTDTKDSVVNSEGTVYKLYKKRAAKGEKIVLEVSQSDLYSVFAQPASNIEPAYDLKPVTSYKADVASLKGPGLKKGQVDGKDRAIFETASPENVLEWSMTTGVADIYSLTVSYHNPHQKVLHGRLQFFAADGTLMKEEAVEFTPTRVGKSNYITTNTGSMINAGHYKVRLTAPDAAGLSVNALDVQ
ncbi:MAG TPA: malectin domain-containing carbohydrate-binding protein [Flavisolibacter sp.]|nr:malectin domain-containing carbohydrate-binding protein [Flavisolibacter sp.]